MSLLGYSILSLVTGGLIEAYGGEHIRAIPFFCGVCAIISLAYHIKRAKSA